MQPQSDQFKQRAARAVLDESLRRALGNVQDGFAGKRAIAVSRLAEFQQIRDQARDIKNHVLENLDRYLEQFEQAVVANGGQVHWAQTPEEGRQIIVDICRRNDAKLIAKGKSMVSEEMALNAALEAEDMEVIETDLGEYIIQLAEEPPSHIIAPAIHKTKKQISDLFQEHHARYGRKDRVESVAEIVEEARVVLRQKFISADVGITGANFLVAETGSTVLVTNEGNGDLSSTLPRIHIVTSGIEKVLPALEDLPTFLRLLARSATGQEMSVYTSIFSGPRRAQDDAGPEQFHIVLLDNGRTEMLASEFREMLRCIRCGACLNHCPVYGTVGGHAYGWVYSGPMGSVLTPLMTGLRQSADLPNACTLNGRCAEVCPMSIPLPGMLRAHRVREFREGLVNARVRHSLRLWAWFAKRPAAYRRVAGLSISALRLLSNMRPQKRRGAFTKLPLAAGWTGQRDFPAPQHGTFLAQWHRGVREYPGDKAPR